MKKSQSAAIPFRLDEANRLSLLLITSRRKGRWVLPKGTVSGMLPHASAAREAFEEAGVIGSIAETPFETYYLRKKVGYGAAIEIPVHTFPMRVAVELQTWPEMDFRQRRWILAGQITEMVESEELRFLLKRFAQSDQARLKA
jgi:8-oxo-dGTP pyrophosphatase MutT (NUDIX family)